MSTLEILNEIRSVKVDAKQRFKPLVIDKHSEELLYSVCDKLEVLDAGISCACTEIDSMHLS